MIFIINFNYTNYRIIMLLKIWRDGTYFSLPLNVSMTVS